MDRFMNRVVRGTLVVATLLLAVYTSPAWLVLTAWCAIGTCSKDAEESPKVSLKTCADLGLTAVLAASYLIVA